MNQKLWYYLSKALGSKEGKNDSEADIVAFIRLLLILGASFQRGVGSFASFKL